MAILSRRITDAVSRASRSQSFLWKFALCSIIIGVAVGYILSNVQPSGPEYLAERILAHAGKALEHEHHKKQKEASNDTHPFGILAGFDQEISDPAITFRQFIRAVPKLASHVIEADEDGIKNALRHRFTETETELGFLYLTAWGETGRARFEQLKVLATAPVPIRFARYATGKIELDRENYQGAFELFRKEGELAGAVESRYMAIHALMKAKDFVALSELQRDPHYARLFSAHEALGIAIGNGDWREILKWVPLTQMDSYEFGTVVVTLCAGLAWALFLFHLGELPGIFSKPALLCLIAFGCGVLSTTPTIYFVILQDDFLKFSAGDDVYRIFAYNIAGVGAREELCKLLLFLPLLPVLVRRDDELEAVIVASFVGLGFAIEENASYFLLSESASAPGRFLTANFFHVALTGLNGLALFRVCTRGASGLNDFLVVFPLSIFAHGIYDALIDLPGFEGAGFLSMVVYIVFSTYFFRRVHELRSHVRMTVSLTGSFVFGISMLAAVMIVFQMTQLGASAGAKVIFSELIGSAVLLFMFFREFNEPLTA